MARITRARVILWLALAASTAGALAVFGLVNLRAQEPQLKPNSLASIGVRYDPIPTSMDFTPAITRERAIDIAKGSVVLQPGVTITAELVLFSDDMYSTIDEASGSRKPIYQNVPAWIVTLAGLKWATHGGHPGYNTEANVAVDAVTGQVLETYAYK